MIERGGYQGLDACLMCHPGPGPRKSAGTGPALATQVAEVEFFGHPCVLIVFILSDPLLTGNIRL